jgi:hypothetical protein
MIKGIQEFSSKAAEMIAILIYKALLKSQNWELKVHYITQKHTKLKSLKMKTWNKLSQLS